MNILKKISSSLCLSILIVMGLHAQVIPTSGNAGSMSSAGQVPVGLFTGTPQVNIPIHNFSSRNISVPISLNYSSNGVRVDEIESHVGMTWNLAAGGVITRTVFDHPDENGRLPYDPKDKLKFIAEVTTKRNFEDYNAKNNDIQQDIFSFNFAGYSGQFFLDDKYQPVLINPSPVKIEMMDYGDADADKIDFDESIQGFKITTPDGYAYYFGGVITEASPQDGLTYYKAVKEGVESSSVSMDCGDGSTTIQAVKTAWHLNTITNVSTATIAEIFGGITFGPTYQRKKEMVRFVYEQKKHTYTTGISESETITYKTTGDDELCGNEVGLQECVNTVTVIESYLKEIIAYDTFPNKGYSYISGKVTFDYIRKPESYISDREYLDKVKVWDVNDNLLKESKLDYTIYRSSRAYKYYSVPRASNRYFLTRVTEISKNGTSKKPYILKYDNPEKLPPRFSYAQDYWGYFNGEEKNARFISTDLNYYNENNYSLDINIYTPLNQEDLSHQVWRGTAKNGMQANRKANGAFGGKGILKKIIYPTGGNTEFIYEPHSYFGGDFIPSDREEVDIRFETLDTSQDPEVKTSNSFTIPFNQQAFIIDADADNSNCEDDEYDPDLDPATNPNLPPQAEVENTGEAELRIKDITAGGYVDIFYENEQGTTINTGTVLNLPEPDGNYHVNLLASHTYELELTITTPCTYATATLEHKIKASETVQKKLHLGGMRIKKVIADDLNNTPKIKEYYYGHGNTLETTTAKDLLKDNSIVYLQPKPAISYSTNRVHSPADPTQFGLWIIGKGVDCLIGSAQGGGVAGCVDGVAQSLMMDLMDPNQSFWETSGINKLKKRKAMCYSVTLSSNTLNPLYTSQGYHLAYTHVTESEGANFSGGGILHTFDAKLTPPGIRILPYLGFGNPPADCFGCIKNDIVGGTPLTNVFGNGNELATTVFKKNTVGKFLVLNKTIYNYKLDDRIAGSFTNHGVSPRRTYTFIPGQLGQTFFGKDIKTTTEDANLMEYSLNYQWQYLESIKELQYDQDGRDVMSSTVNYVYNNPTHMQISRTSTSNSRGETLITDMVYPDDIANSSNIKGGSLTNLQYDAISKLKSYTLHKHVNPVQVSNYEDKNNNGQPEENELLTRVRTNYKATGGGDRVLPEFVQAAKGKSMILEDRMHYKKYDEFDNLLEASKVDGTVTSYIWGYKGTLPVAKLIDVKYDEIPPSLIKDIKTASVADTDQQKDDDLRAVLNSLRTEFPDAMIETYTYDPQIGIKTMTDPRGTYIQYEYDEFNRLEYIKDKDGNILKKHTYKVDTN